MANFTLKRKAWIEWDMLDSAAFKKLSAAGIRVLLRFLQKRSWQDYKVKGKKKRVYDNKGLSFTYAEAAVLGIKNTSFYEAIKRLVEVGFIDLEYQGGCWGKDYSRYSISERWRNYGTEDFNRMEKRRSLQRGLDVRSNMKKKINTPTQNRSGLLRESVVMAEIHNRQGIGNP
jgi:DNA-binding PadR family transcriptional regulator